MTRLKEALSRSSEKHIKSSNQYLEELHKDQLGSRKKTKNQQKIKEKIKADPDVFQRLVNGLRKHATNPKLSDKKVTIICPFDDLSFNLNSTQLSHLSSGCLNWAFSAIILVSTLLNEVAKNVLNFQLLQTKTTTKPFEMYFTFLRLNILFSPKF